MKRTDLQKFMAMLAAMLLMACSGGSSDIKPDPTPQPGPNPDPKPETVVKYDLAPTAVILGEDAARKITQVDTLNSTFLIQDIPASQAPVKGACIIVNTPTNQLPDGLLAKVESVTEEGNGYRITYGPAELTDAFENLSIENYDLDLAGNAVKFIDANGKERPFTRTRAGEDKTWEISFGSLEFDLGNNISLTPLISAKVSLTPDIEIRNYILRKLDTHTKVTPKVGAAFSISANLDVVDLQLPVGTIICGAIPIGPIVLTPQIDFFFLVKAGGKVSLDGSITFSRTVDMKTHYKWESTYLPELGVELDHYSPENEDESSLSLNLGPHIEGSLAFGLGTGPAFGIYGKVAYTGISINVMEKESIGASLNLLEFTSDKGFEFWKYQGVEYKRDWSIKGKFYVGTMSATVGKETPEYSVNRDTRKVLPQIDDKITREFTGNKAYLTATIKEKSLFDYDLYAHIEKADAKPGDAIYETHFDFGEYGSELLEHGESITVTADANLEPDLYKYTIMAKIKVLGQEIDLPYYTGELAPDADPEMAMRSILADLYACRDGKWDGCNWDNATEELSKMKNLHIEPYPTGVQSNYIITIPNDWKLKPAVKVGNRSRFIEEKCGWDLDIKGERTLDSLVIEDRNLRRVNTEGGSMHKLALRNNSRYVTSTILDNFKSTIKVLDLSGSSTQDLSLGTSHVYYPAKELVVNNCKNLTTLRFSGSWKEGNCTMPYIKAYGSYLGAVVADYCNVPDYALDEISTTHSEMRFEMRNCQVGALELNLSDVAEVNLHDCKLKHIIADGSSNLHTIYLNHCEGGDSVIVDNCPNLLHVNANRWGADYPAVFQKLSVKNCPKLLDIGASNTGMTEFWAENLPSIEGLYIGSNKGLCGEVLPIFDQMYERGVGSKCSYDERYSYTQFNGETRYYDRGYGYYYSDEPSRGYHRKK